MGPSGPGLGNLHFLTFFSHFEILSSVLKVAVLNVSCPQYPIGDDLCHLYLYFCVDHHNPDNRKIKYSNVQLIDSRLDSLKMIKLNSVFGEGTSF